jgi:hypothetical protein
MTELEIAVAPMHRLCKKAGADRVSEAAAKELARHLKKLALRLLKKHWILRCIPIGKPSKLKILRLPLGKSWENNQLASLLSFLSKLNVTGLKLQEA